MKSFLRHRPQLLAGGAAGVALASVFTVLAIQAWPSGDTLQIARPITAAIASLILIPLLTHLNTRLPHTPIRRIRATPEVPPADDPQRFPRPRGASPTPTAAIPSKEAQN